MIFLDNLVTMVNNMEEEKGLKYKKRCQLAGGISLAIFLNLLILCLFFSEVYGVTKIITVITIIMFINLNISILIATSKMRK